MREEHLARLLLLLLLLDELVSTLEFLLWTLAFAWLISSLLLVLSLAISLLVFRLGGLLTSSGVQSVSRCRLRLVLWSLVVVLVGLPRLFRLLLLPLSLLVALLLLVLEIRLLCALSFSWHI